jgi:hypothetical protein
MADTYSKLLGLSNAPTPPSTDSGKSKPVQATQPQAKKASLLANQQTRKLVNKKAALHEAPTHMGQESRPLVSPPVPPEKTLDTSLLTTKEKTKYGTYLTDESIEKIGIRVIQLKRDSHQIVQEAINQYFERLEK